MGTLLDSVQANPVTGTQPAEVPTQPMAAPAPMSGGQPMAAAPENQPESNDGDWSDKVADAAAKILYDEKSNKQIMQSIVKGDPVDSVARTTSDLIVAIDDKLDGAVPEEDILPAAVQALERVIELRERATGEELTDTQIQQATQRMVSSLAEQYGTTPEQAQEFANEFSEEDVNKVNQMFGGAV